MKSNYISFLRKPKNNIELMAQIEEAKGLLRIARQEESNADKEYMDVAIEKSRIAMAHLNNLYVKAKLIL